VADQVQENFFSERMEPAMRGYLTELREQAFIDIKPGYTDSGASAKETKPLYSAYVPPAPKKKKKIERTRFRESTHTYRQKQKAPPAAEPAAAEVPAVATVTSKKGRKKAGAERDSLKPGKKEKIRYGKAPSRTLPSAPESPTEDAGATSPSTNATVAAAEPAPEPVNPLETKVKPTHKTRISARVKTPGAGKVKGDKTDKMAPVAPDSSEVADRQVQSGPLGLSGDTAPKKKKHPATTTGDKTRMADKNKKKAAEPGAGETPQAPAAPAQ
jgi:peptidyl-prolyl cis-trans isomerase SurA